MQNEEEGGLGFHDISRFNQALLCKQAWRILYQPQSLLSRILEHCYFRNSGFLNCGVGTRPSYTWRSIIHSRKLLKWGLVKAIDDGRDTNVWCENWIMDGVPRPPLSLNDDIDISLKVSELINHNTGCWDVTKIYQTFVLQDAPYIPKLKISSWLRDTYYWGFSKTCLYTSQSGYRFLETLPDLQTLPMVDLPPLEINLWSNLWKVNTSPKIQHFLWKALAGALAVAEWLQSRSVKIDPVCSSCDLEEETICHVLFNCHIPQEAWELSRIPLPSPGFSQNSVLLNLHHMLSIRKVPWSSVNIGKVFPWLLWHLWKEKNMFVFEKKLFDSHLILARTQEETEIWMAVNKPERNERSSIPLSSISVDH